VFQLHAGGDSVNFDFDNCQSGFDINNRQSDFNINNRLPGERQAAAGPALLLHRLGIRDMRGLHHPGAGYDHTLDAPG
jgi:hypothetical protein